MFEQLFGSKTRVKLMRLFLENPGKKFYIRELTRLTDSLINSVRRELSNLIELRLILEHASTKVDHDVPKALNSKRFYYLNVNNPFHKDLLNLFMKGKLLLEKKIVERIKKSGELKYLSLGGVFAEDEKAATDLLVVGDFDAAQVSRVLKDYEEEIKKTLRYTVMTEQEFQLRRSIADNFLDNILTNANNTVVVDKITRRKKFDDTKIIGNDDDGNDNEQSEY